MSNSAPYFKFGEFFSDFLDMYFKGMTQTEVANELLTRQAFISKIKRGERLPSQEIVKRIFDLVGKDIKHEVESAKKDRENEIRENMIKSGKSSYYDKVEETLFIDNDFDKRTKPRLPVKVAAGMIAEYYDGVLEKQCERTPIIKQFPSYDFTMIVQGDSMEPKFEGGDEIACEKISKIIEPGKTYLIDTKDGAFLKRAYPDENGIKCVSYNPQYSDFYIEKEDINGVYRVVGLIRFNI